MNLELINANKPLTHMSKFIFIDACSKTDSGSNFANMGDHSLLDDPDRRRQEWLKLGEKNERTDLPAIRKMTFNSQTGVLDALGKLSPQGWYWNGKAFYDNRPGRWASFPGKEMLSYDEFSRRIPLAAIENAKHQEATELSPQEMRNTRDSDNCFRIVELGIPACDVVILGKPHLEYSKSGEPQIVISEPD